MATKPHTAVDVRPKAKTSSSGGGDAVPLLSDSAENKARARGGLSWGRLCAEARPVRCRLVFGTLALFVSSASNLALPALFGVVIDALSRKDTEQLNMATLALIGVTVGGAVFSLARAFLFNSAGVIVVARLREKLFAALLAQEVGFFDSVKTGELLSRLGSDTTTLKDAVTVNISMGIRWVATILGGLTYLFVMSWKLTLVMLGIFPIIGVAAVVYGRYVRHLAKAVQKALAEASEVAEETFSSIRRVRSFVGEPAQTALYNGKVAETQELGIRNSWANGVFIGITTAVASAALLGLVWYGGTLVIGGDISEGILTSFLLYAIQIGGALGGLAGLFGSLMAAMGANDRVFRLLDRVPAMPVSGKGLRPASMGGDVELEDVHFRYPTREDAPVLRGLSLKVRAGEVHALVGPSGAGKSTVVSLVERFYDVQEGVVRVGGHDVRSLDPAWLRSHIGLVRQEPVLFSSSIRENIRFGRPDATDEEVEQAARLANAHEFISAFPDGYDTLVGEKGVRLSGGQKQRVSIAAATLMGGPEGPRVLLLDEATSALDAESEHLVQAALERLMVGRTTIIVAHRLSTVRRATCVHVVKDGRVAASGTHADLMRSSPLYAGLVRRQLEGMAEEEEETASATAASSSSSGSYADDDAAV